LETKQKELTIELEKPETYASGRAMQINRELVDVHDQLPVLTSKWEAASRELEQFASQSAS
jgi:hypothetical protein